jgi:CubicO group peptidase (beta-lactamase class C family)
MTPPTTPHLQQVHAQVDEFFGQFITPHTPGAAVMLLDNGTVLYQAAYGLADLDAQTPLTVDHGFHIASMSKQMTAIIIMMLAEQGMLAYDAPLNTYIPELNDIAGRCTIRQMLHHTAGLPDYADGITTALLARSDAPTNADIVAVMRRKRTLHTPPGTAYYYSNVGYELLAVVVERITGQAFPDVLQTRIFDVLGMTRTFSMPNPQRRTTDRLALSYTGSHKKPTLYDSDPLDAIYGSGSVYTTLGDLAMYDAALYGNTLVSQQTYQVASAPAVLNDGSHVDYGFGLELGQWHGESYVAHSGSWLGFNSDYVRFAKRRCSAIVLLNRDYEYPNNPRIALQIAALYLATLG